MNVLKINNTDSLLRDYYQLDEASEKIGCNEKDILWFARERDVELCMEFHDDEYDVSCGLKIDGQMDEFLSNLKSLPRDRNGNIMLSDLSSIRIPDENNLIDENGFIRCFISGLWAVDYEYKDLLVKHEGQPDSWPQHFLVAGTPNVNYKATLYVNYDEKENYYLFEVLWITKVQIQKFIELVLCEQKRIKHINKYKSQSEAQKQKHAVPRAEILMAVISLYHRDMRLRRESPAAIADYLFQHASEFWPKTGEPPLSYDTV
ncbi:TPA: hypothetical protein ND657_003281, partial [Enterobacter hormaechei]|nr:hypothetical protein [Enterobacter hormaechei]